MWWLNVLKRGGPVRRFKNPCPILEKKSIEWEILRGRHEKPTMVEKAIFRSSFRVDSLGVLFGGRSGKGEEYLAHLDTGKTGPGQYFLCDVSGGRPPQRSFCSCCSTRVPRRRACLRDESPIVNDFLTESCCPVL
jgi:hypothetical protein